MIPDATLELQIFDRDSVSRPQNPKDEGISCLLEADDSGTKFIIVKIVLNLKKRRRGVPGWLSH